MHTLGTVTSHTVPSHQSFTCEAPHYHRQKSPTHSSRPAWVLPVIPRARLCFPLQTAMAARGHLRVTPPRPSGQAELEVHTDRAKHCRARGRDGQGKESYHSAGASCQPLAWRPNFCVKERKQLTLGERKPCQNKQAAPCRSQRSRREP